MQATYQSERKTRSLVSAFTALSLPRPDHQVPCKGAAEEGLRFDSLPRGCCLRRRSSGQRRQGRQMA